MEGGCVRVRGRALALGMVKGGEKGEGGEERVLYWGWH
jgi:hypothetical protein